MKNLRYIAQNISIAMHNYSLLKLRVYYYITYHQKVYQGAACEIPHKKSLSQDYTGGP
jgi:hypothetical protein